MIGNKNIKNPTVEYDSTYDVSFRKINSTKNIKGTSDTPVSYADAVRNPSRKEIVRENINVNLLSSEGQAVGKPSGQDFLRFIEIK